MSDHKITALVTGASAGLGTEFCRQLAQRCDAIIAVARRGERLAALADELADSVELHVVVADLGSIEGVARTMEAIRQQGPVDYLVNNAGFATFGQFAELPIDGQRGMVDLHIDATITLCRAAIPFMLEQGSGYIINVSSIGAFSIAIAKLCRLNWRARGLRYRPCVPGIPALNFTLRYLKRVLTTIEFRMRCG